MKKLYLISDANCQWPLVLISSQTRRELLSFLFYCYIIIWWLLFRFTQFLIDRFSTLLGPLENLFPIALSEWKIRCIWLLERMRTFSSFNINRAVKAWRLLYALSTINVGCFCELQIWGPKEPNQRLMIVLWCNNFGLSGMTKSTSSNRTRNSIVTLSQLLHT